MGKKRIITKPGDQLDSIAAARVSARQIKKKVPVAVLYVLATFNNTKIYLTDPKGGVVAWSTSGSLGFKGAKKGTPYAASKVAEVIAEKARTASVKDVSVVVRGVGAGRESAIRTFASKGFGVMSIKDMTPIPHNGPKLPKPRRV